MKRLNAEDTSTLLMALVGYQLELAKIEAKMAEIRGELAKNRAKNFDAVVTIGAALAQQLRGTGRKPLSAAARKRIAAAQRKRWASWKKEQRIFKRAEAKAAKRAGLTKKK